jgi:hypothetical protein
LVEESKPGHVNSRERTFMDLFAVDRLPGWLARVPDPKRRRYLEAVLSSHLTASNAVTKTNVKILAVPPNTFTQEIQQTRACLAHGKTAIGGLRQPFILFF